MNKVLSVLFFLVSAFFFSCVIFLDIKGSTGGALILLGMAILVFSAILFTTKEEEGPESF
jgi:hypothetical protein